MYSVNKRGQSFTFYKNLNAGRGTGAVISVAPEDVKTVETPQLMFKTCNQVLAADMLSVMSIAVTNTDIDDRYADAEIKPLPKGTYCLKLNGVNSDGDENVTYFTGSKDDIREISMRIREAVESDPNPDWDEAETSGKVATL